MKYGYARVSTDGQSVDAQVKELTKAGCEKVFREVASGAKTDRAQLRRAIGQLAPGDVLMVTRLDRLARSTRDLLNTLAAITDTQGRVPLAWRHMGRHHHIARPTDADRARRPGRVRARADPRPHERGPGAREGRGVRLGRKPKLTPHQQREAIKRRDSGEETLADIARSYNVSHSTISRLAV